MVRAAKLLAIVLVVCPGCVVEEGVSVEDADLSTTLEAPPDTIITEKGAILRLVGPAKIVADAADARAGQYGSSEAADHVLDQMTPEELAEALRPVTVINENEYIGDPDVELAATILEGIRLLRQSTDAKAKGALSPVASETFTDGAPEAFNIATIFGSDNRTVVTNTTVNPYSAQVAQWYNINQAQYFGCSATLIGKRTAISAAHCFHTGVGGGWRPTHTWAAGARISYPANPYPYGTQSGCYVAYIPQAYVTINSSSPLYDYAVIDYQCGLTPGNTAGKLLWGVWSDAAIEGNAGYVYGYPTQGSHPRLLGMGVASSNVDVSFLYPNYVFYKNLDTSDGQSGAGFFQNIYGGYNVSAIHVGPWDADENVGRRITSDVSAFISANSVDF